MGSKLTFVYVFVALLLTSEVSGIISTVLYNWAFLGPYQKYSNEPDKVIFQEAKNYKNAALIFGDLA